ncbi:MAG: hypothetical protein GC164_15785 [Phycisphaera sp.]|nr:hypothetical protein [Phycisphaera sp.]
MKIDIQARRFEMTPAIAEHVEQRMTHALNQHDKHVQGVEVVLEDVNGPKGGVDKICKATALFEKLHPVIVEERGEDLYLTVSKTADRIKVAVGRMLDKVQDKRP